MPAWILLCLVAGISPRSEAESMPSLLALPAFSSPSQVAALRAELVPRTEALGAIGAPIVSIELDAPAEEDAQALLALTDLHIGYLLEPSDVRLAIERLYALGRFAQVEASITLAQGAVQLTLRLTPVCKLERIEIVGLHRLKEAAILRSIGLLVGDELDSTSEATLIERASRQAADLGHPLARVQVDWRPGTDPSLVAIRLKVDEGPVSRIAKVTLDGALPVRAGILGEGLYAKEHQVADLERLEQDRLLLRRRLRERGFVRAQVRLLPLEQAQEGAHVTFHIEAFERLRFHFAGNLLFDDAALQASWPGQLDGAPAAMVPLFRQRIEALYLRAGYPHARVRTRLLPAPQKASAKQEVQRLERVGLTPLSRTAELFVAINEGAAARVDELALIGNTSFPVDVWQQQVRGRLSAEAADDAFFLPLGPAYRAHEDGRQRGVEARAPVPAPEQRYVPDIYQEAALDVGNALQSLGFLEAELMAPSTSRMPAPSGPVPIARGFLGGDDDPLRQAPRAMGSREPKAIETLRAELLVQDGAQTFIERLTLPGNGPLAPAELRSIVAGTARDPRLSAPIGAGSPLSLAGLEDARIAIIKVLRNQGYLYATVEASVTNREGQPQAVDVELAVRPGPKVVVDHLLVRGNRSTRAGVIASRLSLRPGKPYRLEQAIDDQQQVMALGTFARVNVRLVDEEHQSDHKDVVVEVEERPRQIIEIMPGLSSTQGPRLLTSYTHLNVFGTASTFVAALKLNRQFFFGLYGQYAEGLTARYRAYHGWAQLTRALEREVRLGLRAPPLRALYFDPLFRLDIVDQRINAVRYGLDATTATLGADLTFYRRLIGAIEVQGGVASLECPLGDNCDNTQNELRRLRGGRVLQQGRYNTIKVGPWLRYEGRNDTVSPSRGIMLFGRLTQVFGETFGRSPDFTFRFVKYEGQASTYVPLGGTVLALSLRFGTMQIQRSSIPVDERFLLGGRDSLRGFVEGTLIADDACVVYGNEAAPPHCADVIAASPGETPVSLGGNSFALLKTELRLPLRPGLSFDIFADIGNLWVDLWHISRFRLRYGTGVGLRYATPVGAMTFDFGINPARRPRNDEAPWQFHFSIGSF